MLVEFLCGVGVTLLVVFLFNRRHNRRQSQLRKRAKRLSRGLAEMRLLASYLPDGTLLNVTDQEISQLGEAAVLDGMTTKDANALMLQAIEDSKTAELTDSIVFRYQPHRTLPGAD